MTTTSNTSGSTSPTRKVALVAGASRGIGADTARAFARAGYAVVLGARDDEALAGVAADIEQRGGQCASPPSPTSATPIPCAPLVDLAVRHVRPARRGVQQRHRRADAGPARRPRSRRLRPRHPHQRPRHLPRDEVRDPRHARTGRRRDRQHGLGRRRAGDDQPRRVRRGQGRHHRAHRGRRARLRESQHPRERRRARADPHLPPRAGRSGSATPRRTVGAHAPASAPPTRSPTWCSGSAPTARRS